VKGSENIADLANQLGSRDIFISSDLYSTCTYNCMPCTYSVAAGVVARLYANREENNTWAEVPGRYGPTTISACLEQALRNRGIVGYTEIGCEENDKIED
jgi:hypothetical protein